MTLDYSFKGNIFVLHNYFLIVVASNIVSESTAHQFLFDPNKLSAVGNVLTDVFRDLK